MHPIRFNISVILLSAFVLIKVQTQAQNRKWGSNLLIEGRVNYGFLINHHLEMKIFNAHFPAYEINIGKQTDGRERWQSKYNYPVIGVSLWYSHLGNSPLLGSAFALYPYISYPLIKTYKNQVNFRLGVGLSYITKPFDRLENYKYIAIGSHINAAIHLLAEYKRQVSERTSIGLGFSAMHFSNGSTKTPNYGINAILGDVTLAYRLNKVEQMKSIKLLPALTMFEFPEKTSLDFAIGTNLAFKDMGSEYGKDFMIYNLYGSVMKPISFKSSAGLELNLTHNRSDVFLTKRDKLIVPMKGNLRIAIAPMYELRIGKLSYDFGVGFYLHKIVIPAFAYFKIGFKIQVTPTVFTSLALHTHLGQADFVGFGVGYKFPSKHKPKL